MLASIFMPAGLPLDYFVYPQHTLSFFQLRMFSSVLSLGVWWLVQTPLGSRVYHLLGLVVAAIPSFFICCMIYVTEGPASPYYAGLNTVLVGAGLVLRWTFWDTLLVFVVTVSMYLAACLAHGPIQEVSAFFGNLWFMTVTGTFVVIGSYIYNRLRYREFALRFELDRNREQLEESNRKLLEMDQIKSRFFANISHELRTPLTLLIAPLENLINRFSSVFDESIRQTLHTMHSNGMRLLKLINDLLDLVRLESGVMQVKLEAVRIDEFVRGLASAARQMADDKRIHLRT